MAIQTLYECYVEFTDEIGGGNTKFVSMDGECYYEHNFPEKGRKDFHPMRYHRRWLKDLKRWDKIKLIEFTEHEA